MIKTDSKETMKSKYFTEHELELLEASFQNSFFYFLQAVDILSLDALKQCETMGNFNVAWEIQHDVCENASALLNWPISYLTDAEKGAVSQVVEILGKLPEGALASNNNLAMNHPAWAELRIAAKQLQTQLAAAVRSNLEFFSKQAITVRSE